MKEIESHGMSSEKASRIKIRGHRKEYLFADLIGANAIKGTDKIDILDKYGKKYTIKGGSEIKGKHGTDGRWQLFLFRKSRFERETNFPARDMFMEILDLFPKERNDYLKDEAAVKNNVVPSMKRLKDYMSIRQNMRNFLSKSIFNFEIDFLVVYHNDLFMVFDREEVLDAFDSALSAINNASFQKVVFSHENKIAIEIEVRKSKGKYPSILLTTNKNKVLNILLKSISACKPIKSNISAYGNAIEKFKI